MKLWGVCILSEGPACQVRCVRFDDPFQFIGRDKRVPPIVGGTCLSGPPNNVGLSIKLSRARQACPSDLFRGGTCLSGPLRQV